MEITRHINLFQTAADKQAAIDNDQLNYPNLSYVEETGVVDLAETAPPVDYSKKYFTIVSLKDGNNIDFVDSAGLVDNPISASTDGGKTWRAFNVQNSRATIATLDAGEKVMIKGIQTEVEYSQDFGKVGFDIIDQYTIEGNIMSLVYGDNFATATTLPNPNMFKGFFSFDYNLISAENLVLPATTLKDSCYYNMFYGCTSLTTAPSVLPAMTLRNYCYYQMFADCSSLTTAPALPAGTLTGFCYTSMFQGCTSLITAPDLPATRLEEVCYTYMFRDCTNLNYIKMLATDISARNCLINWVSNVASTGTFVKKAGVTIPSGASGIPTGWTVIEV